jgi:hypothetical protein
VPEVPGLPNPPLESGPLRALEPLDGVIAWAETEDVSALRSRSGVPSSPSGESPACSFCARVRLALPPTPGAAARANHKGLALEAARAAGCALPGARVLRSLGEIDEHLGSGAARESPSMRWVLKAPYSAGGRLRVRGAGPDLDVPARRAASRLLELQGEVIFEPWMDRVDDAGAFLEMSPDGPVVRARHRILGTGGGVFRGICIHGSSPGDVAEALSAAAIRAAGRCLGAAGYGGPFGIDSWTYRTAAGEVLANPIGEINARLTFGAVAAALAERLRGAGAAVDGGDWILRIGKSVPAGGSGAIPLLLPGEGDPTAAWMEP